jgi:Carboxypeptidase regulatory-like domain
MNRTPRIRFNILLVICCLLAGVSIALSQGTDLGTIRGTVTDQNGAAVVGATVHVTDVATGTARDLTTNDEGNYEAANVKTGTYIVTVSQQGFNKTEIRDVVVRSGGITRADAELKIGVEATVDVTSAPVIETETSTISTTLDSRHILEVPRDSRDIYQYLYLNPNITQANGGNGEFKFIGAQSYGASFSLDGQRANGGLFAEPTASQPSIESIGELTVLSNNFTAEYAGIANIRVNTRRGTKDFHGSLFYNNKNSALAAQQLDQKIAASELFTPTVNSPVFLFPTFNLNETGGSIGGPVPFLNREKTFFFGSYERRWDSEPFQYAAFSASSGRLPSQRVLNGDFSQLPTANKPRVPANILPLLTPAELANNTVTSGGYTRFITIPQRLINPGTSAILQTFFPHSSLESPVDGFGRLTQFVQNLQGLATRDLGTFRLDHTFSARNSMYGVYNISRTRADSSKADALYSGLGLRQLDRKNHTLSLSFTHMFSSNVVNEARGGFNIQHQFTRVNQTLRQFLTLAGFDQSDLTAYEAVVGPGILDLYGEPGIQLGDQSANRYRPFPVGGRSGDRPQDQDALTFGDTLSWVVGRHSLKMGFDIVHNHGRDAFVSNRGNVTGVLIYRNSLSSTGSSITNSRRGPDALTRFLLGQSPDRVQFVQSRREILDVTNFEQGYYFQDEFRVSPRLTLHLGLRYELITPFVDKNNLMVNFDPNFVDPTTKRHGRFIVPATDVIPKVDPAIVAYGVVTADVAGVGRGLVNADKKNFAPRLGFAFRINDKTVIRGGYGIFYPTSAAQGIRDALESAPFNQGRTKDNHPESSQPLLGFPGGLNGHGISPVTGGRLLAASTTPSANVIPFNLHQPRIHQFNFTFERELGHNVGVRISYLGTRMQRLIAGQDLNEIAPSSNPFGTTTGDGVTICDPLNNGDCDLSPADTARRPFPELGDFLASYGNIGNGKSNALQIQVTRRFSAGFSFDASYTLLDQKSNVGDAADSSLGDPLYNQFVVQNDFSRDSFVSRHRLTATALYDLPFGHGRHYGAHTSRVVDAILGGWQLSTALFAKSGTGFTPWYDCGDCDPVWPGNVGSSFPDATAGFNNSTFRPRLIGDPRAGVSGDIIFNAAAFAPPDVGSEVFNSGVRRQTLTGPGSWATNLGIRKNFKLTERVTLNVGAIFDNLFNHPLLSPVDVTDDFSRVGTISLEVDQNTGKLLPINTSNPDTYDLNPNFGRLNRSISQEGFDSRRSVRLTLRLTF